MFASLTYIIYPTIGDKEVIVSRLTKQALVHQLTLIFSDNNRVILSQNMKGKLDELSTPQLSNLIGSIDSSITSRVTAYHLVQRNLI